jgi:hypothetical protein
LDTAASGKPNTEVWADHSSKESYCLCRNDYETEEEARAQQKAVEILMSE